MWLLGILIPGFIFSQTDAQRREIQKNSDTKTLQTLSTSFRSTSESQTKAARSLALQKNWPLTLEKDSVYSELIRIGKNNQPVYFSTYNRGSGITSRANTLYTGGSLGLDINGEDMIAGIWDAGSGMPAHELFSGRLQVMDETVQPHFHAVHVCGTVIGTDQVQDGNARGMAYKGKGHSYDWNNDLSEVADAALDGLLLSNHSYGYNPEFVFEDQWGKYDDEAAAFDQIMFAAPYYQMVCAAGNSRGNFHQEKNGYDLLTGHTTSKNAIVVANVYEVLEYTGPASVEMSASSSWGPTDDFRIKPDISTKGMNVFSAINQSQSSYNWLSGTSMASPGVTGTLLLLQQYNQQRHHSFLKAATLRGLMIHAADEAGDHPGPDARFGWGLINAKAAAETIRLKNLQSHIQENTLSQGQTYELQVQALGDQPLVATLCWTDPAGNPVDGTDNASAMLINDLDIRIIQGSNSVMPWKLDPSNPESAAITGDNTVDNVERAQIQQPSGTYTIRVSHKGNLLGGSQNYSLIVSGVSIKKFWFETDEPEIAVCKGASQVTFPFELSSENGFTSTINLQALNLPSGSSATFSPASLSAPGTFELTISGIGGIAPGVYQIDVKGTSGVHEFVSPVTLSVYDPVIAAPTVIAPATGTTGVTQPVSISWNTDENIQEYQFFLSTDATFQNIVSQQTLSDSQISIGDLENNTSYFWKVIPANICGSANPSTTFSFTTACAAPTLFHINNASTTTATVSWNDPAQSGAWKYQVVAQGSQPTNLWLDTTVNPLTINNLAPDTCYDLYVLSDCDGGDSLPSQPFGFCTQLDYCNGAHFLDSGGINDGYQNSESMTRVIFPDAAGTRLRAIFNMFSTEENFDYLTIYNGPDTNGEILFHESGDFIPADVVSTHVTGALTFVFESDLYLTGPGWDISFICEALPLCAGKPNGLYASNVTHDSATFTWNENSGSTLWQYAISEPNGSPGIWTNTNQDPFTLTELSSDTCYEFYVRSVCGSVFSDYEGPYFFSTKPDYCNGALFLDSGGISGNYTDMENITTIIYPDTPGRAVTATFLEFSLEDGYDFLSIYDGPGANNPMLVMATGSNSPGTVVSTHPEGALTFVFTSDQAVNESGWQAAIDCQTLGVNDAKQVISFYPNPVSDRLSIEASSPFRSYEIYDANLRRLFASEVSGLSIEADFSRFAAGLYFVCLRDASGRETTLKILKK